MNKQAHLVDFTPCLHEYAKGAYLPQRARYRQKKMQMAHAMWFINPENSCGGYDSSCSRTRLRSTHTLLGETTPVRQKRNWEDAPEKQKKMVVLVHNWLSRWLSAYHHFISHNTSGTCTPTAGCLSMRRRKYRVVICKQWISWNTSQEL